MAGTAVGPQLAPLQKAAAQAIVNIFETGRISGVYGQITLLPGDPGHLTYGRSQTTLASGNLYLLLKSYCDAPGAFSKEMEAFLPAVQAKDFSLDTNVAFRAVLREAGDDPVMHAVQDQFFDRVYWAPAAMNAQKCGVVTPLGTAVIYDSHVHGSFKFIRDETVKAAGTIGVAGVSEQKWVQSYVDTRRNWLANNSIAALHATVYRMDTFRQLISQGKWQLELPLQVRGAVIDENSLGAQNPVRVSAEASSVRVLHLVTPPQTGKDVSALQKALTAAGFSCAESGTFDEQTCAQVKAFQSKNGLKPDGMVGPATRAILGL